MEAGRGGRAGCGGPQHSRRGRVGLLFFAWLARRLNFAWLAMRLHPLACRSAAVLRCHAPAC